MFLAPILMVLALVFLWFSLRSRTEYACPECQTTVVVEHMLAEHCNVCGAGLVLSNGTEQATSPRPTPRASEDVVCPFCRERVTTAALRAECADCATPHHLACYEEQGGCSIYGCTSRTVKARAHPE